MTAVRQTLTIDPAQVQGMPPTSGFCDDPVNTATGGFVEAETDLVFDGGAAALAWPRCYNATDRSTGAPGPGWSSPADSRLSWGPDGEGRWRTDDGRLVVFPRLGEGWDRSVGASWWLERLPRDPDGASAPAFEVTDSSGGSWLFDAAGRTVRTSRGSGTAVTLAWDGDRLVRLSHERGRSLEVDWDEAAGRIAAVRTDDGRAVRYDYDGAGRLVRARGADRGERRYGWDEDSGLLARITDADGVVEVDNTYDEHGRVASQRSPFGRVSRYAYMPGLITLVCDENGERANTWISDEHGRLIGVIDSDGGRAVLEHDAAGRVTRIVTPAGSATSFEYDDAGRPVARRDPDGAVRRWEYSPAGRLTASVDPLGARTTIEYDASGTERASVDSLASRPILAGQTMDALFRPGGWKVVGNRPSDAARFLPAYKMDTPQGIFVKDFLATRQRPATPEEAERLPPEHSTSPMIFQMALNSFHGLADHLDYFDTMDPDNIITAQEIFGRGLVKSIVEWWEGVRRDAVKWGR